MRHVVAFCISILAGLCLVWLRAKLLLWGWGIYALPAGLHMISLHTAIGMSLLAAFLLSSVYVSLGRIRSSVEKTDSDSPIVNAVASVLIDLIVIGIVWFATWFYSVVFP